MTRLVFLTGPGGAGTTTLAAATAVRLAADGHRVLLLGVDDAGDLEAVLGVGAVADGNVDGIGGPAETDARRAAGHPASLTVERFDPAAASESALADLSSLLAGPLMAAGLSAPDPTEIGPVPGLPDILALRRIAAEVASGVWDTVVVDGPPLNAALAMLAWPETAAAALRRLRPVEGQAARALRPLLAGLVGLPTPFSMVTKWTDDATAEIDAVRAALTAPGSVVRIVGSPARTAQPLLRAAPTVLALHGMQADTGTLGAVPREPVEPLGVAALEALAKAVYGAADPRPERVEAAQPDIVYDVDAYRYDLPLPGVERDQLGLVRGGDELVVTVDIQGVATHRRAFVLPPVLRRCRITSAKLDGGVLRIGFKPDESLWPERFLADAEHTEEQQEDDR